MDDLEKLREVERQIEREWWWLNGAIHAVAQTRAEGPSSVQRGHRQLQEQVREIDRRRVEVACRIAALTGPQN